MADLHVEPGKLDGFAGMLTRFSHSGTSIWNYVVKQGDPDSAAAMSTVRNLPDTLGFLVGYASEEGVFAILMNKHEEYLARAETRAGYLRDGGNRSSEGVSAAAKYYRQTDHKTAAALDAETPDAKLPNLGPWPDPRKDPGPGKESVTQYVSERFVDISTPEDFLTAPDGADLEPKADAIQQAVDDWANRASVMYWWEEAWTYIEKAAAYLGLPSYGQDPISFVIQVFTGDWALWARYADAWRNCSKAVQGMHDNVKYGTKALGETWRGHAADNAMVYFAKFSNATGTEADFYDYLFRRYRAYLDIVYDVNQDVFNLVNTLIDSVATAGLDGLVAHLPSEIGGIIRTVEEIFDVVGKLSTLGDASEHQIDDTDTGAVENAYRLLTMDEPPAPMAQFTYYRPFAGN